MVYVFTESAPRPIQSSSRDVHMYVPSVDNQNRESWRLLVKECIANIGKLRTLFLECFMNFCVINIFWFLDLCEPALNSSVQSEWVGAGLRSTQLSSKTNCSGSVRTFTKPTDQQHS